MRFQCTEVERLYASSAFPVTFTPQMSNTTLRPAGTKEIHLQESCRKACVRPLSLTRLAALREQMLDLSDTGPELIGRGGVGRRARAVKGALQDQSPGTQGLKVGQPFTQSLRTRDSIYIQYRAPTPIS